MEAAFGLTAIASVISVVFSQSSVDVTEPCRYPVAVGIGKEYIRDQNMFATTEANDARGARFARLRGWKGGGAWTAGTPNNLQYLTVDLGHRHVVNGVATQGRRGSDEFVTEYYLEYSSDNRTWSMFTNEFGAPLMFDGNTDDDLIMKNDFSYPIVAKYVRINPQRWSKFISMRIELYGCRFDGESATFDGQSRIIYDISGPAQYVQTRTDDIKLRFKTNQAEGLLLFADGNQGDYLLLELLRGRLYLRIDLGSTATASGDTLMQAGSLLDDNQWHDVEISRHGREIMLIVDRLKVSNITNGDFYQLDLDRQINLGGISNFLQPGKIVQVRKNFTGCMENVWFDYMNMIKDARQEQTRFRIIGNVMLGQCQSSAVIPFTFPTLESHLEIYGVSGAVVRFSLHFRTYNKGGLIFYNKISLGNFVMVKINNQGFLEYRVKTENNPEVLSVIKNADKHAETPVFTDGLWHVLYVSVESGTSTTIGKINVTVDGFSEFSARQMSFTTDAFYLIGGDNDEIDSGETGFLGCMRFIDAGNGVIDRLPTSGTFGVMNGTCSVQDRCDPNPCEHGGICSQDYQIFTCDCSATGYEGAVCHKSRYLVSCEEARMLNPTFPYKSMTIDIDDSGPLEPFAVDCKFEHDVKKAITEVHHDQMQRTMVNGYQEPGSYARPVDYGVRREVFDELIERSQSCRQYIRYTCHGSRLLTEVNSDNNIIPSYGWWVGRTNLNMRYWGGSSPGSGKCACALKNDCKHGNPLCNCDAGLFEPDVFDDGFITHKEHLPVMELRFGDTGTLSDQKYGEHQLGALQCEQDNLFDNVITFRKEDAVIRFPTFEAATSGDIRFQFKTTVENGIFLQNTGQFHFIEIKLVFGNTIQFRFDVGNGIQTLEKITAYPMNDNDWHTIHIERNRRQAMLKIDQQAKVVLNEPIDQGFRVLKLNSDLIIGASVSFRDGFVGCMRALMVNGKLMDLRGEAQKEENTYGIGVDCHPKCESNPCMNNGICIEWYSHYQCDCAYTPYRGWTCGREVGINLQPDYMVRYELDHRSGTIATDEETIIIGFSTQVKKGILMQITNDNEERRDYISIEVNNNGGVKVALDVGWEIGRDEVNNDIQDVDLANGQQHVVTVRRYNKGRGLIVQVDDYPEKRKEWHELEDSTDTKLNNPKYIYFGRNVTRSGGTLDGFKGCLFRAQFDNLYPLKRVFQDPTPSNIFLNPQESIREDMCGFEEVTHPPDKEERRPDSRLNTTTPGFQDGNEPLLDSDQQAILIAGCVLFLILLLVGIIFLVLRYVCRQKGNYLTNEAKNSEYYDNADFMIADDSNTSGQPGLPGKKEVFL